MISSDMTTPLAQLVDSQRSVSRSEFYARLEPERNVCVTLRSVRKTESQKCCTNGGHGCREN